MNLFFPALGVFLGVFLTACAGQPDYRAQTDDPETVASVDLERYAGLWYEIARYPNGFQENCEAVTAEYSLRPDGKIDVVNTCGAGNIRTAKGVARTVEGTKNTQLKVKFAPAWVPFASGDYWVLHLEPDYSAALVGAPSGKYLWVLARQAEISDGLYQRIVRRAEALGYQTEPLKLTQHPTD